MRGQDSRETMKVRPFSGHRHRRGKASPQGVPGRSTGPGKDTAGRSECGSGRTGRLTAPRTSEPHPAHKTYPYLLRKLVIERPNHVWCADATYIPMRRGFLYLVAVMDWATRKVLAWRLSNTTEADFCVAALKGAMDVHGKPEIFNT